MTLRQAVTHLLQVRRLSHRVLFDHHPVFSPTVVPSVSYPLDYESMRRSLQLRNHSLDIDFNRLSDLHDKWSKLSDDLSRLTQQVNELKKTRSREDVREYYKTLNTAKSELQSTRKEFLDLYLQLPNLVDPTAHRDERIIQEKEAEDVAPTTFSRPLSELVVTSTFGNSYLLDSLARWEREMLDETFAFCQRKFGFIPVLLSDFARAPIVAATCNRPARPVVEASKEEMARIDGNFVVNPYLVYYLVGSCSLEAFLAFLMRHGVQKKSLPLRMACLGREYVEDRRYRAVQQHNGVSFLEGFDCPHGTHAAFLKRSEEMWEFWRKVAPFFRLKLVSVASESLLPWERARHEIVTNDQPLARLSLVGDWLSRRLLIRNFEKSHLHLLFTTFLNTDSVIKAMLSTRCGTGHCDAISERLREEMIKMS